MSLFGIWKDFKKEKHKCHKVVAFFQCSILHHITIVRRLHSLTFRIDERTKLTSITETIKKDSRRQVATKASECSSELWEVAVSSLEWHLCIIVLRLSLLSSLIGELA